MKAWDSDPRRVTHNEWQSSNEVRERLQAAASKPPAQRWAPLARELDPRLLDQDDWPTTAAMLQQAHEQGHDVGSAARALVDEAPLGDRPARDLRCRIVSRLKIGVSAHETSQPGAAPSPAMTHEQKETAVRRRLSPGRRDAEESQSIYQR